MAQLPTKPVTYDDILALPPHVIGELVDGELHVSPRPSPRHSGVSSALGEELGPPFKRGRGGPGGWMILDEPELHLHANVLVPDLVGWRRERMPALPVENAYMTLTPDWLCEVLSPSTAKFDRTRKLIVYARERVPHVWFLDPATRTLEVMRLDGDLYRVVLEAKGDDAVRAEPFDAIVLELAVLWAL